MGILSNRVSSGWPSARHSARATRSKGSGIQSSITHDFNPHIANDPNPAQRFAGDHGREVRAHQAKPGRAVATPSTPSLAAPATSSRALEVAAWEVPVTGSRVDAWVPPAKTPISRSARKRAAGQRSCPMPPTWLGTAMAGARSIQCPALDGLKLVAKVPSPHPASRVSLQPAFMGKQVMDVPSVLSTRMVPSEYPSHPRTITLSSIVSG